MRSALSRTSVAATCVALPASTPTRLANVPMPWGISALSPLSTVTASRGTPSASAQI